MYCFDDILGNEKIIFNLKSAAFSRRIPHAYIFDAPEGMGKMLLAKTFAKAILCSEKNGCGHCGSCLSFDNGNNPDVIYVKSAKKSLGIDEIREQIGKNIDLKPYLYEYKIFIVENAELMTVPAQNALLKTLEEPPHYAVFILLSNNSSALLTTVLSRCVIYKLKPLKFNQIKNYLIENENISPDEAEAFSGCSQGSLGKAVEMSKSEDFKELRDTAASILCSLKERDLVGMFNAVGEADKFKENIQSFLDIFVMLYRDSVIYKCFNNDKYIIQKDKLEQIKKIASNDDLDRLVKRYEAVLDAKRQFKSNSNFQMTMEVLFLKLKEK